MNREILPRGYDLHCTLIIESLLIYVGLVVFAFVSGVMDNEKDFSEFLKFALAAALLNTGMLCFGLYKLKKGLAKRRERKWHMEHADFSVDGSVLKVQELLINHKGDIVTGSYAEHAECHPAYRLIITYIHPTDGTRKTVESELYQSNPNSFLDYAEIKIYLGKNAPLVIAVYAK